MQEESARASLATALFTPGQRMHSSTLVPYLLLKVSIAKEGARLDIQCTIPVATLNHIICQPNGVIILCIGNYRLSKVTNDMQA